MSALLTAESLIIAAATSFPVTAEGETVEDMGDEKIVQIGENIAATINAIVASTAPKLDDLAAAKFYLLVETIAANRNAAPAEGV